MSNFFDTPAGKALLHLLFLWLIEWLQSVTKTDAEAVATNAGAFAKKFMAEYRA